VELNCLIAHHVLGDVVYSLPLSMAGGECVLSGPHKSEWHRQRLCESNEPNGHHAPEAALQQPGLIRTMSEGARKELTKVVALLWKSELEATVTIREGNACEVILREAIATEAVLIIIGTRGRSWLSGFFRRNTVKRVIQSSPCPVVVVRAAQTESTVRPNRPNGLPLAPEFNFG
jgi:nucleotide-binding universal stress UspA family protein